MAEFRCSNIKCKKLLAEMDVTDGKVEIKCKCGMVNTLQAEAKDKPYVHNQPYQNRMDLVRKGGAG